MLIDNRFDAERLRPRGVRRSSRDVPPAAHRYPARTSTSSTSAERPDDDIRGALLAPPVQQIERPYTLDEVLRNEPVRAYSPRIDLDTITFEFGSATIGNDQMQSLAVSRSRRWRMCSPSIPDEVYLIEGHTDAVGSDYDNLILSDRRAEAVAVALSQNFDIPPENLVTQGYGEQYLKIDTDGPSGGTAAPRSAA